MEDFKNIFLKANPDLLPKAKQAKFYPSIPYYKSYNKNAKRWEAIDKFSGVPVDQRSDSFKYAILTKGDTPKVEVTKEQFTETTTGVREYTPENITSLKSNEVFVFGANTAGGHGGGTAGLAQRGTTSSNYTALPIGTKGKWAEYGVVDKLMEGTEGKSFGIVTKAASISGTTLKIGSKRSVPLSRIEESINALIRTANENPDLKFLVTKFGTNMAGFSIQEMKSLLENKTLPNNIILPKEFEVRTEQPTTQATVTTKTKEDSLSSYWNGLTNAQKESLAKSKFKIKSAQDLQNEYDMASSIGISKSEFINNLKECY